MSVPVSELAAGSIRLRTPHIAVSRKKFQSWEDRRVRVSEESRDKLESARREGKLHEALLDRRESMKADRYCK